MARRRRERKHRKPKRREVRKAQRETAKGRPVTVTTTQPAEPAGPGMLNIDGTAVYSTGQGPVMAYNYVSDQGGYPQQYANDMASESSQVSPV